MRESWAKIAQMLPSPRKLGGALVAAMAADAAYWNGGLLPGDVIHAINGKEVAGLSMLRSRLEELKSEDAVVFQVQRQEKLLFVAFELR